MHSSTANFFGQNNNINYLHERCRRLIYNDKKSYFEDLLQKDWSVSMNHRNLTTLAAELLKVFKGIIQLFLQKFFLYNNKANTVRVTTHVLL